MATQYETEKEKYHQQFVKDGNQGEDSASAELRNTTLFALNVKYVDARRQDDIDDHQTDATANAAATIDFFPRNALEDRPSDTKTNANAIVDLFPQYALLGLHVGDHPDICKREPIMLNTATPNSAFICGSQGSGKSYTLACMLENYLLPDSDYGPVANPVAGVAFHYDSEGGNNIAEVASLCSRGVKVRILVSRGSYRDRRARYTKLAGGNADNMDVRTLGFKDEHINVERMKRLMAFSETAESGVPLYVSVIQKILREMNEAEMPFSFDEFEHLLSIQQKSFAPSQTNMLHQRMEILRSFRHRPRLNKKGKQVQEPDAPNVFKPDPKTLTIVDLTDPFIDKATACVLFNICLELFKENKPKDGIAIVLDEAHRYMDATSAATAFTESLLASIMLQRHDKTRVIIATQEPTISPKLMDLCSMTIVHRFSSPAWFNAIKDHLAAASEADRQEMFEKIVRLDVGESLVFSPSSFLCLNGEGRQKLGTGVMKMKTRGRKGLDIGKSGMAGGEDDDVDDLLCGIPK
jgi:hypothetical protein